MRALPASRAQTPCVSGDANCDGRADITDFEIFRKEYSGQLTTKTADFDGDGQVTVSDFEVWRRAYFGQPGITSTPTSPQSTPTQGVPGGCVPPYTATSPWNTKIGANPTIHSKNQAYIASLTGSLGSDTTQFTMAVYSVDSSVSKKTVKVAGYYSDVTSPTALQVKQAVSVQIPIPVGALPASGTDSQIVLVNEQTGDEWGLWQATPNTDGTWSSKNGYHYNTAWSGVPPNGFLSRGAGVPYLTGLIRPCEIKQGHIDHAIAFAYDGVSSPPVYPATKSDGTGSGMPEGTRLQLNPSITDAQLTANGCTNACLTIAHAMQQYGMYIIDFAGHPKIYAEYEGSAKWTTLPTQYQVNSTTVTEKKIPYSWLRVIESSAQPTTTVTPTPTTGGGGGGNTSDGIWVSRQKLVSLPMSGPAWDGMKKVADGDVGTPNMSDQDSPNPERTLAVALVAARTGLDTYRQKAVASLVGAIGTERNPDPNCASPTLGARGLAVGRNLIGYVVAADVIDFRTGGYDPSGKGTQFQQWVDSIRHRKNCDNNGAAALSGDISQGHDGGCSNGNSLAGASRIAAAAYLNDKAELDKAWLTFQRYAGNAAVGPVLSNNSYSQTWLDDPNAHVCINKKGAAKNGVSIDGVLPNDQGRGGPFQMPPLYTQYPWEGLQGIYAQAVMLDRLGYRDAAGKTPWHVSDDALKRGVDYQWSLQQKYGGQWFDSTRAAWVKHLSNVIFGTSYSVAPYGSGRNMDYTQWTHQLP